VTAPITYAELVTEVENHSHRADITADVPMLIQLGEARLNRRLKSRDMLTTIDVATSTTNNYVSLPVGLIEIKAFSNDYGEKMIQVSHEELEDIRYALTDAYPRYYALGSRIDFERTDSNSRNYPMTYYKELDIASSSTEALAVLARHPDLYIYSAMLGLEPFMKNDKRITLWAELVNTTIKEINNRDNKSKKVLRSPLSSRHTHNILRVY